MYFTTLSIHLVQLATNLFSHGRLEIYIQYVVSSNIFFGIVVLESPEDMEEDIPVVICAAAGRMGAAITAISSIYSNTGSNVLFYIVGMKNGIPHIRQETSKVIIFSQHFYALPFSACCSRCNEMIQTTICLLRGWSRAGLCIMLTNTNVLIHVCHAKVEGGPGCIFPESRVLSASSTH